MYLQTEIAKRLNAILAQIIPFLSQEVKYQPATSAGLYIPFTSPAFYFTHLVKIPALICTCITVFDGGSAYVHVMGQVQHIVSAALIAGIKIQ